MDEQYDRREMLKWLGGALLSVVLIPLGLSGCGGGNDRPAPVDDGSEGTTSETSDNGSGAGEESGPTHEVPHPSDAELSEAEQRGEALGGGQRSPGGKSSKDSPGVSYQHEPNGDRYCGNCTMYVTDQNDDGLGACTMVEGTIHPCDYCILYTEHGGEGAVPCGA